jgi:hypothetical protein
MKETTVHKLVSEKLPREKSFTKRHKSEMLHEPVFEIEISKSEIADKKQLEEEYENV